MVLFVANKYFSICKHFCVALKSHFNYKFGIREIFYCEAHFPPLLNHQRGDEKGDHRAHRFKTCQVARLHIVKEASGDELTLSVTIHSLVLLLIASLGFSILNTR